LLKTSPEMLRVEVRDSGPGFDPVVAASKGRLGMRGMRQRVEVLGGVFELQTTIGSGTLISVSIPLTAENSDRE
jgi:signal transduction histidine kinase